MHVAKLQHPFDLIFGLATAIVLGALAILTIPALITLTVLSLIAGVKPTFLLKGGRR